MRDFLISTDSNSDLPESYIKENNIVIIPHYYDIGGVAYGDEINLTPGEFYDKMRSGVMPTTMASNPDVIRKTFDKCVKDGYDILHFSFSSALSGGHSNVTMGGCEIEEENPGSRIRVIDTANVSLGEGLVVMKAVELKNKGLSLEEIDDKIEEIKKHFITYFTVDDLFHLHRGGRLSKTTAIIGSIANIKPILCVNDEGKLVSSGTIRGRKRSINSIIDNFAKDFEKYPEENKTVCVVHGDVLDEANYIADTIKQRFGCNVIINMISPSIGAHSGPGALGLCYYGEKR